MKVSYKKLVKVCSWYQLYMMKVTYRAVPRNLWEFSVETLKAILWIIALPFYLIFLIIRPFIAMVAFLYMITVNKNKLGHTIKFYDRRMKEAREKEQKQC